MYVCLECCVSLYHNRPVIEYWPVQKKFSLKGVLRTMETLNKFKHSARTVPGCKPPLLCYCEHLMRCAPAYRALSKEEELECAQCALDNGEFIKFASLTISLIINFYYGQRMVLYLHVKTFLTNIYLCVYRWGSFSCTLDSSRSCKFLLCHTYLYV